MLLCFLLLSFKDIVFYKLKVCGNSICSFYVSASYFGNSRCISNFIIIIFVMKILINGLCCYYPKYFGVFWTVPIEDGKLNQEMCVLWIVHQVAISHLSPSLRLPYSSRHNNIEIKPINNPTTASKYVQVNVWVACLSL